MKNTGTLKVTTPSDTEIAMTRVFNAPRENVFAAITKPELLKRWFGPRGWTLAVCEIDLRVGGKWRFVLRGPEGQDMGMSGASIAKSIRRFGSSILRLSMTILAIRS